MLRVVAGAALIAAATFLAYFPSLTGGFISDDHLLLIENSLIKDPNGLSKLWLTAAQVDYWPVSSTTLWIEWRLWGMNPTGYRVTNLVLHILTAWLGWAVLRKLTIPGAFLAALLFALHPVNVASVAWIAQRKNLLALLFFLASIFSYLRSEAQPPPRRKGPAPRTDRWYWLSLLAFVLAMLSKGTVAMLPVLLLGMMWWRRPLSRRDLTRVAPYFAASLLLVAVNMSFQARLERNEFQAAGWLEQILGVGGVVWFYLYKAILPVNLAFHYPEWRVDVSQWHAWLPLLAAVVLTWVLWRYRRSWGAPLFLAWSYFCIALLPALGSPRTWGLVADYYQHLALIGIVALAAASWAWWWQRVQGFARWPLRAAVVAVPCVLAFLTWQQARLYADVETLYRATLQLNPNSWAAHNNLGFALLRTGHWQEAMRHFAEAVRIRPDYADAHNNLGSTLLDGDRLPEAREHLERALEIRPLFAEPHYNLGRIFWRQGQRGAAVEQYVMALRLKPELVDAHDALGHIMVEDGRPQAAIGHFEQAVHLKPDYVGFRNNLGAALLEAGRLQEAIVQLEQVVQQEPSFAEAHSNLARALSRVGRRDDAIEHFERALQIKPDSEIHNNLGVALAESGRFDEAIEHLQQALQLRPDDQVTRSNLQEVLDMQQKAAAN